MKESTNKFPGDDKSSSNDPSILSNSGTFADELVTAKEITAALRIGNTKWWEGVRRGIYPAPVRLGARCTRWRKSTINQLIQRGV